MGKKASGNKVLKGKEIKRKNDRAFQLNLFQTLRFKLILLGSVSLAVLLLIGIISMVMLSNSNRNYEMANHMNEVSRLSEKNDTLMVQYIASRDVQNVNDILTNREKAYDIIHNNKPNLQYRKEWGQLEKLLDQNKSNMQKVNDLSVERGFDGSTGIYQNIVKNDSQLHEQLAELNNIASWIDISMISSGNFVEGSTELDGTTYQQFRYVNNIPDSGNRNKINIRIGGDGVEYKGTVYLTDVTLRNGNSETPIDLDKSSDFALNNSYGSALTGVEYTTFNGKPAYKIGTNFTASNNTWEEISVETDVSDIDITEYDELTFEVYMESTSDPFDPISLGASIDQRYDFEGTANKMNELFNEYNRHVMEGNVEEATPLYEEITAKINEMKSSFGNYFGSSETPTEAIQLMDDRLNIVEQLQPLDAELLQLSNENKKIDQEAASKIESLHSAISKDMDNAANSMTLVIIGLSILAIATVATILVIVLRSVQGNLSQFKYLLEEMGKGNLSVRAKVTSKDEFSLFSHYLNTFIQQISTTLRKVQDVTQQANEKNKEVYEVIHYAVNGSGENDGILQLHQNFKSIEDSVTNQSANTEESLASLQQILDINKTSVEEINHTQSISKTSLDNVENGVQAIDSLNENIAGIATTVDRSTKEIQELIEFAKSIEEVLITIENFADQTNLLSLNASIEASRAGEEGKGFAVVANEVKKLSNATSEETQKISAIINNINNKIAEVQAANHDVNTHVTETETMVSQFNQIMDSVKESTDHTTAYINKLKEQITEQMVSTEEVVQAVDYISSDSQEIQEKTAITTAVADELAEKLVSNLEVVEQLMEEITQIKEDINFFELGEVKENTKQDEVLYSDKV